LALPHSACSPASPQATAQRPALVNVADDAAQARYIVESILENREAGIAMKSQAVLFRTSSHSASLEIELTRRNIPFSITSIGNYSFGNCYGLTSVVIPNGVTDIGIGAFSNCGLHAVVIPVSVSAVEDRCFQGCYSLTTVTIPISITSIGNYSFYDCYALSSVTIPSNVSSLGDYLFSNCYKLMSVTVAASVTGMGVGIFSNCYDLTSIAFCGNAPSMGSGWKTGCVNMTAYYFGGATGFTDPSWTGVTLCQMTSPWAPQGLTAVPADGSVSLSWKAPSGAIAWGPSPRSRKALARLRSTLATRATRRAPYCCAGRSLDRSISRRRGSINRTGRFRSSTWCRVAT